MSPVKSVEFVPPRVKTPPGARDVAEAGLRSRANQNDISGVLNWLVTASQNGVEFVLARASKARPIRPDTGASTRPVVIAFADTRYDVNDEVKILILKDNHEMFEMEP